MTASRQKAAPRKKASQIDDHRIRVARERRDRMRRRLMTAVMTSYQQRLELGPPGVDEVIKDADVSRATFYKYFNSVDEAIHFLGGELVDEMTHSLPM